MAPSSTSRRLTYRIGSEIYFYTDLDLVDLTTGAVELVSVHPVPTAFELNVEKQAQSARFSPDGSKVLFLASDGFYDPRDTNQLGDCTCGIWSPTPRCW